MLKDNAETIKERARQLEGEVQNLTRLVEKLEAEKDRAKMAPLIRGIRGVGEEQRQVCMKIEEIGLEQDQEREEEEDSVPKKAAETNASFDFGKTTVAVRPRPPVAVPASAVAVDHFARAEQEHRASKRLIRKKNCNRIVTRLLDKAQKECSHVYAMPRKLLLRTITRFYAEVLTAPKGQSLDLSGHIFASLLNKFGLQNAAERKFLQVSTLAPRIRSWQDACDTRTVRGCGYSPGLWDCTRNIRRKTSNYTWRCCGRPMWRNRGWLWRRRVMGVKVRNFEADEQCLVPYVNAHEFARRSFEQLQAEGEWKQVEAQVSRLSHAHVDRGN